MPENLNIQKKKCPRCGSEFNCSTSSKCWCYEYDIPAENLDKLEAEYDSCLCPECLKLYTRAS
ncbi:MAG: cysteine-rich CWC family protein [Bacteroidetes bacterium]|nr:cysteine-rich CWC family protein [Bacteroidota bacterium]